MVDTKDNFTFWEEIKHRFVYPFQPLSLPFIIYFAGVVIFLGGFGIWSTLYSYYLTPDLVKLLPPTIGTYFIALWATSIFDLYNSDPTNQKAMLLISVVGFAVEFILLGLSFRQNGFSYFCALMGLILALAYWFIANSYNDIYYETFDQRVRSESKNKHGQDWGEE